MSLWRGRLRLRRLGVAARAIRVGLRPDRRRPRPGIPRSRARSSARAWRSTHSRRPRTAANRLRTCAEGAHPACCEPCRREKRPAAGGRRSEAPRLLCSGRCVARGPGGRLGGGPERVLARFKGAETGAVVCFKLCFQGRAARRRRVRGRRWRCCTRIANRYEIPQTVEGLGPSDLGKVMRVLGTVTVSVRGDGLSKK